MVVCRISKPPTLSPRYPPPLFKASTLPGGVGNTESPQGGLNARKGHVTTYTLISVLADTVSVVNAINFFHVVMDQGWVNEGGC